MILFPNTLIMLLSIACCDDSTNINARYNEIEGAQQQYEFLRSLFQESELSELIELTQRGNDSVATQSAWEVSRVGGRTRDWFMGYFEGRNRINPPSWWRKVIMEPHHFRRLNITPDPYRQASTTNVTCPADANVLEAEGEVTYLSGNEMIVIPEELLERDKGELIGNYSCAFTDTHCFVSNHDDVGSYQILSCIERVTNRIVWSSKVCGCFWGCSSGIHVHWVALTATSDGRVFVFGSASTGFYSHGFDATNGRTIMQFVSSN
jgi:hypothetical protein